MIHTGDQELELFLWDHWYHGRWNQGLQGHVRLCSESDPDESLGRTFTRLKTEALIMRQK